MKPFSSDRFAAILFTVSLIMIAMIYGIVSSWRNWFPAPQVGLAHRTLINIVGNWKNDFGLEPTRHLIALGSTRTGVDRGDTGEFQSDGHVLIAGLNDRQEESFHVVQLLDRSGKEIFRWPVHYEILDTENKPTNVMLHGMEVLEDGSLIVTFDAGNAIARIDACGKPLWVHNDTFHHSITRNGEGQIVTLLGDGIAWLDEDSGEVLGKLDIVKDMTTVDNGAQQAMLDIRTRTPENADEDVRYLADAFHINDAEPLRSDMADAFPMFAVGDVLISLRELNLIAVIDPENGRFKWWRYGPWFKQHDPDFESDGSITVYDNATGSGASRILRVYPGQNSTVDTLFSGSSAVPFYSWRRGKHQRLPGGNLLITEAEGGRVLEVSSEGELLWARNMVWDAEHNLIITEARFVSHDFFTGGVPGCESNR